VAKVVQAYLREPMPRQELPKETRQRSGVHRTAVFPGKDVMIVSQSDAKPE
jgi:hypothetical protein